MHGARMNGDVVLNRWSTYSAHGADGCEFSSRRRVKKEELLGWREGGGGEEEEEEEGERSV